MKRDSIEVPLGTPQFRLEVGNSSSEVIIGFNLGTLKNDIKVPM
jgi:hypothetical protein